jgi:hypothetical protein
VYKLASWQLAAAFHIGVTRLQCVLHGFDST